MSLRQAVRSLAARLRSHSRRVQIRLSGSVVVAALPLAMGAILIVGCWKKDTVGVIASLSGAKSEHGRAIRDGALLAFELEGVRSVVCDDSGTGEGGAACVRALADSGIRVAVGPDISVVALGAVPEANRRGMLLISSTVSTPELSRLDDLFVRLCPHRGGAEMLSRRFAASPYGRIVVLMDTTNHGYSKPFAQTFEASVKRAGKRVAATRAFIGGLDLDFTAFLDSLPDSTAVLFIGTGMDLGILLESMARSGRRTDVYTTHWALGADLFRVAGKAAEGLTIECLPEQFGKSRQSEELRKVFQERYGYDPSFSAIFGWEAARLAMPVLGVSDPVKARKMVVRASGEALLGWSLRMDEFGDPVRSYEACVVRNGRIEVAR